MLPRTLAGRLLRRPLQEPRREPGAEDRWNSAVLTLGFDETVPLSG